MSQHSAKSVAARLFRRVFPPPPLDPIVASRLTSINEVDPRDIFIAGYPKSGNTWMQNMVAGLLYGMDLRLVPDSLVESLVPDVQGIPWYRRHVTPMFFKTHHLPRPEYRRVIHLIRDGRDAMVSYFHHLAALQGVAPDYLQMLTTGEGIFPSQWHEHVEAWEKNPHGAEMITVRYEDLKRDAVAELERICAFAGLKRDRSLLENAARSSSFEAMREKEKATGWDNADWPKDKPFVRRGKVGSFRDEMPEAALKLFMEQSAETLRRCGYDLA